MVSNSVDEPTPVGRDRRETTMSNTDLNRQADPTTCALHERASHRAVELLDTEKYATKARGDKGVVRRAAQRGMVTAEYAVGILAAVALALVLLKIFTNNDFFTMLLKFVLKILNTVSGQIK